MFDATPLTQCSCLTPIFEEKFFFSFYKRHSAAVPNELLDNWQNLCLIKPSPRKRKKNVDQNVKITPNTRDSFKTESTISLCP